MRDEEVSSECLVACPARTAIRDLNYRSTGRGKRVNSLPRTTDGSQEKPSKKPCAGKGQQSAIHARGRTEARHLHCLVAVEDAHHREFPQQVPIALLENHPSVIPSHGVPRASP